MEMWPEQVVGFDWDIDYNDERCCETGVGDCLQMLKKIPSVYEVGSGIVPVVRRGRTLHFLLTCRWCLPLV